MSSNSLTPSSQAKINDALLWEAVKHYRASLRRGTAATKNRKLVSGAGKKALEAEGNRSRPRGVRSALLSGVVAVRFMDLSPAATTMRFRRRS